MKVNAKGQIVTFYSYKGGVGRTMALANIAFLAAANGKAVLVMDWDLEAPGLLQYFRALIDPVAYQKSNEKEGILNLLWTWRDKIRSLKSETDVDKLSKILSGSSLYKDLVSNLFEGKQIAAMKGKLDYIGPGSNNIKIGNGNATYEAALGQFNWSLFQNEEFAPLLLNSFKTWASANYDYILIDSRTGLADVAGVCTMQIPNTVALFYVLNRQNYEGIAKVAGAIRRHSKELINLRAIPTRTFEYNSDEQSEARANAIYHLTQTGGFSSESANHDLNTLQIFHSPAAPYLESLTIFTFKGNLNDDPLTLKYLSLTNKLLDATFSLPKLPAEYLELVRNRISTKNVTHEYLQALSSAEPTRGMTEIISYLNGIIDAEKYNPNRYTPEYVREVLDTGLKIKNKQDGHENQYLILEKCIEVLRIKYKNEKTKWRQDLINYLEEALQLIELHFGSDEALATLDEIDDILSVEDLTINLKIKRVRFKVKAAEMQSANGKNLNLAKTEIGSVKNLISNIISQHKLAPDQMFELRILSAESTYILGEIYKIEKNIKTCILHFNQALYEIPNRITVLDVNLRNDADRLKFILNYELALIDDGSILLKERMDRAIDAANAGSSLPFATFHFSILLDVFLNKSEINEDKIIKFCRAYFFEQDEGQKLLLVSALTRTEESAKLFLIQIKIVLEIISRLSTAKELLKNISETLKLFKKYFTRRFASTINKIEFNKVINDCDQIISIIPSV